MSGNETLQGFRAEIKISKIVIGMTMVGIGTREIIPEVMTEAADRIEITQATIIPIETGATEMMKEKSQEVETAQ
jgi:vacuolar-type H+-ATPase subunit F/Vma7